MHPERMQAIPGPWPSLIREVQSIVLGDDGFGEDLDWGHDRGRDFHCLATIICLITCHSGTSFPSTPKLEKWLSTPDPVDQKTRADVLETFKIFIALVKDKKFNAAFKKPSRVSPVEFTMTGVLISRFKKTHSLTQLSSAIWQMRADVRKKFVDVRANNKVVKVMFDFLKREFKDSELASDGKGDVAAAITIKSAKRFGALVGNSRNSSPEPAPALKSVRKRRRVQVAASSDESDSEDEPIPAKRRVSAPDLPASSSRAAATKATASKTAGARKVSAPAATKAASTASTSKAATKTSNKSVNVSRTPDAQMASSSSTTSGSAGRSSTLASEPNSLTTRRTMTSMSAAVDSLFSSPSIATGAPKASGAGGVSKKSKAPKATPAATVKMEVGPPSPDNLDPQDENAKDENAMSVQIDFSDGVYRMLNLSTGLLTVQPARHRCVHNNIPFSVTVFTRTPS